MPMISYSVPERSCRYVAVTRAYLAESMLQTTTEKAGVPMTRAGTARAASGNGDARELALAGLDDHRGAGGDDEALVGDHVAIHLEPALRDEAQRFRCRRDDPRLLRELRDRQAGARGVQRELGHGLGHR